MSRRSSTCTPASASTRTHTWSESAMLEHRPHVLLVAFLVALVALNAWRLEEWGADGFRTYLTQAIMQTTLFDFACVLAILLVFIARDARTHHLTWWWILPTFPF